MNPATPTSAEPASAHRHSHDHDHSELGEWELRVRALETLLVQKGYVDPAALDRIIETYETKIGPHNGAQVVARAWVDPAYRGRLLEDATAAIAELGFTGRQGEHMIALENTADTHHMVVCTLCSCYPWPVLGLPPVWYKSAPYRAKAVMDPRGVLADFGVTLPQQVHLRSRIPDAKLHLLRQRDAEVRQGEHMIALENTADTHHMVVCTLCSCYPWPVLGLPPVWYKSAPYRAKAVMDPRGVLADFGVTLPQQVQFRVWDSTAEVRYLVIPMRPGGTDGFTEEQLAALVTRDSMIGTGLARTPGDSP